MKTGLYPVVTLLSEVGNYLKRFECIWVRERSSRAGETGHRTFVKNRRE